MSQGMNEFLAAYYETAPQPTAEELQHAQQIDFFAKTAAANGIDLEALNQDQVQWLWNQVFTAKTAEPKAEEKKEEPKAEEKKEEKPAEKKAEAEFAQKKEAMAKIAEADFLGRVMAHSFYNESVKIAAAKEAEAAKVAEFPPKKEEKSEEKEESKGESLKDKLLAAAKEKKEEKPEEKKASVSDLDLRSAQLAVQKLASSNYWDVNEGVERLNAVLTLGAKESVKVASAPDFEAALDIRALELLELAGYPIKWEG